MTTRAKQILLVLDNLREDLLGLSDDIWLDVDHNDTCKVREACEFKTHFNEQLTKYTNASDALATLIAKYTGIPETDTSIVEELSNPANGVEPEQPGHPLNRSFTYTRPYGYVFEGRTFKGVKNWVGLYLSVCAQLEKKDPEAFRRLASSDILVTRKRNKMFSENPGELNSAKPFQCGIYAEGTLSANQMRNNLAKILPEFQVDLSTFRVLLRVDPPSVSPYEIDNIEDLF